MQEYSGTTSTKLTEQGQIGAGLFVLSPIAGGLIYGFAIASAYSERTSLYDPPNLTLWWALLIGAGVAWLVGAVLLFTGREYTHRGRFYEVPDRR